MTLTLLRATQLGSRWPAGESKDEISKGHCPGRLSSHYGLYPHAGDRKKVGLWQEYRNFAVPLLGSQYFGKAITCQKESPISLEPSTLETSCLKKAENEDSLVIRLWNPLDEPQIGTIRLAAGFSEAQHVNSKEEQLDNSQINLKKVDENTVQFTAGKKKIVTILFRGVMNHYQVAGPSLSKPEQGR